AREHLHARPPSHARVRARDGRAPAGAVDREDGGAVRADLLLPLGPPGDVAAGAGERRPSAFARARARRADRASRGSRAVHLRAVAATPVRPPGDGDGAGGASAGRRRRARGVRGRRLARAVAPDAVRRQPLPPRVSLTPPAASRSNPGRIALKNALRIRLVT